MNPNTERYPWMATPLPTHSPRPVEICKEFMSQLATKSGYKSMGIKSGTPVYVTKLIATRHDCRGVGLASKLFDEAIRFIGNFVNFKSLNFEFSQTRYGTQVQVCRRPLN